jgi:membrane-associated phospholipid phosphatase
VLALAAIWLVAELVPAVRYRDAQLLYEFTTLERPRVASASNFLLHLLDPSLFILWAIALVAVALARERPRVAVAVAAILGLGPLTAEKLKPLLAHAHAQVGHVEVGSASWPSGHSTAAGVLVIGAVLVAPAALRVLVATVGTMFVLAVGAALLIMHWHMPSDVLGGWFVAVMWGSLAVAALRASERLRPSRRAGDKHAPAI